MIKIKIIAVGNLKESYLRAACDEYAKRLSAFCRLEVLEIKEASLPHSPSAEQIKAALTAEGAKILAAVPPRSSVVALCVEGGQLSSEQLAQSLEKMSNETGSICFIIGGSNGLSPEVKRSASLSLSFSKMTFPHQLMRVVLLEQVYRSFMINSGRSYHK